ncbi:glutamate-1-semialdehyde 2,1-aminomutase, chloroplastic-like [Asparagus officinalis]|uniref:glutamate-1-semialdehyde 2,1-aminomutase, chloroplastic-like n=1 Tax=Asparagus officinalis TaxID=4686 RepID=UPI00098E1500|nr:glutamate-1-semialdehyde 2,1-aminomutase, chloroplastic-like [Asparagus officinalis]
MTAGIHTLKRLQESGSYEYLDKITGDLVSGVLESGKEAGHEMCGGYVRGMFGFFFTGGPVYNFEDAKKSDTEKFARFHRGMLEEGVYLAPSQFEAGFTSLAHSSGDIERTVEAAKRVFSEDLILELTVMLYSLFNHFGSVKVRERESWVNFP